MTREEAIKELSYIADEMPSMECADWREAISMAIKVLEQKLINISCKNCKNFNHKDNYCSLLQINWLPDDFGCVKGEEVGLDDK